jgi:hypothetical protein
MERLDLPLKVRNVLYSWGHHRLVAGGKQLLGFTSFTWDEKVDRPIAYDADRSRAPAGRGKGKYVPGSLKLKGYAWAIAQLKLEHAKLSPNGRTATAGEMLYQLQLDAGTGDPLLEWEFQDVAFNEESTGLEDSADPLQREVTLQPMRIREKINGVWVTMYDSSEEV